MVIIYPAIESEAESMVVFLGQVKDEGIRAARSEVKLELESRIFGTPGRVHPRRICILFSVSA